MEALQALMDDASRLANEFYQALKHGLSLGFDAKELEGFSLNLKQTQAVAVTETYYQSGTPVEDNDNSLPESPRPDLLRFSDIVQLLRSIEEQQENNLPFGQSLKLFHDAFKQAVNHDHRFSEADSE